MLEFLTDIYGRCNFFIYLLVAVCLLCYPEPRRKGFAWKFPLSAVAGLAVLYGYSRLNAHLKGLGALWPFTLYYCVNYFLGVCLVAGCIRCSFRMPMAKVIYYSICGYAIQHLAYAVFLIVNSVLGMNGINLSMGDPRFIAIEIATMAAVYLLAFFLLGKYLRRVSEELHGKKLILPFALMMAAAAVISVLCFGYAGRERVLFSLYAIMVCAVMLFAMYKIGEIGKLQYEKKTLRAVAVKQKEQYEIQKRNIEYINIKCHDLRKQIDLLRGGKISDEKLKQLQDRISIYDNAFRTGNETLDVILSDKGLYCEREGIRFTCIADGAKLDFMDAVDTCAVFVNLIDNAIEAVMKIEDADSRMISLKVSSIGNLLHVVIFNNYEEEAVFVDGAFRTTKGDSRDHGFGLKSVKAAVAQYGGEMKVHAGDGVFSVNILIPMPAEGA